MSTAHSKITSQGQISVPAEIRKRLGVGPGSILEWDGDGIEIIVRRAGRNTSANVHDALFPKEESTPPADVKEGIKKHIRQKHARR